jgi:lipopolysaccharide biosynthesis regulator YciM
MGGAVKAIGNVVNQVSNFVNQVANVLRQGIQLLQGVQRGLNSMSQAMQGNRQDNQRADAAAQRAVDDRALDQMREQRSRSMQRVRV